MENGRLYTQYRPLSSTGRSQEEVVTALDAATGATIWEHRYPSSTAGVDFSEGAGPHATPLIAGNKLIVVGSRREFMELDKTTGKLLWSHDLIKEYRAPDIDRGMANSPMLFNNTVLLPIGDKGQALGAFNVETGALIWKSGHASYSPASPMVIDVDGQKQAVVFGGDRIIGLDPTSGAELWNHPHRTDWGLNNQLAGLEFDRSSARVFVGLRHWFTRARAAAISRQDGGTGGMGREPRARPYRHDHSRRRHGLYVEW